VEGTVMRKFILIFWLSFGFISTSLASDRPETSRYLKAYGGGEGVVVWVLRVGPQANQEALVQISGIDHESDRRIRKLKIEQTPRGVKYVDARDGKRYEILTMEDSRIELFAPGVAGRLTVSYDKALSAKGDPEHFLTEFLDQK
jgi:hypothetical protein